MGQDHLVNKAHSNLEEGAEQTYQRLQTRYGQEVGDALHQACDSRNHAFDQLIQTKQDTRLHETLAYDIGPIGDLPLTLG